MEAGKERLARDTCGVPGDENAIDGTRPSDFAVSDIPGQARHIKRIAYDDHAVHGLRW